MLTNLHNLDQGTRDDRQENEQDDAVRDILRRRQRTINPTGYGVAAAVLASSALLVWGSVHSSVRYNADARLTTSYAAFLSFAILLGLVAAHATFTWMIVRDGRRRAAEEDVIREFHHQQQIQAVYEQVLAALAADKKAERLRRWDRFLDGPAAEARASGDQVIPFDRGRGGTRNGS